MEFQAGPAEEGGDCQGWSHCGQSSGGLPASLELVAPRPCIKDDCFPSPKPQLRPSRSVRDTSIFNQLHEWKTQVYLWLQTHASFNHVKLLVSASAVHLNRVGVGGKDIGGYSLDGESEFTDGHELLCGC